MQFTLAAKAELLAFVESLDPSEDTAPLHARILELETEVGRLSAKLVSVRDALAVATAAAA